ncbi:uncharacterized protein Triagg1_3516 [Trichoderma aggressivum f. europaeum]|uniref:Protein NO VEIN C-terminal domain-containing protein n=1 Tax=Trichoderma aggressivum f. europaeum TaxID=173218 RepID=A0AAE1M0D0_9HYPO|nr:hypothetical protein Triagg1_3516 [Trichoderma aggressivum f. europaeum]
MSTPVTNREEACVLVKSIAQGKGHVHDDDWKSMDPDVRERVQKAMENVKKLAGNAVTTLGKNIYTSDARFVFELLQNAEDNSFNKAIEANLTSYVSFEVHPGKIIIQCNEDGFESENLEAICAVGESSKSGSQKGYVGEKGIGFKSVFKAAWKVHIKSGYFSFFFEHKKGDPGLGMITPVWEDPKTDEPHPGTRMELELGDGHNPISSSQYQNILDQYNSLSESILLFMRNVEEIRISIFDNEEKLEKSNTFSRERINENLIRLAKVSKTANNVESSSKDYYIFKHTITGLDKNENRIYSESEEENKTYASAEVVLGFPLTEESVPIVEYQEFFTFLPMKQSGFTFLINSDFVTEANRQDIVTTSSRNIGIRRGIADAFIQAIHKFCTHPKLQYTWMRYLPEKKQHFDPFWSQLVNLLGDKLNQTAILRPRSETSFCLISSLRFPVESQFDRHGEPLFRDSIPEKHISKNYSKDDIMILRSYGLKEYTASEIVDAISLDLNTIDSRMKSHHMDDDWHSRSANYLRNIILTSNAALRSKLRTMPLLPLQDGTWIAAENQYTFFSRAHGLEVPPDLGLSIINSEATQNAHRRQLFSHLGTKEADISFLRQRILLRGFSKQLISSSVTQLKYMFLTDKHRQSSEDSKNIRLVDSKWNLQNSFLTDIYMPDDEPFGPSKLLEEVDETAGFQASFLDSSYLNQTFQGDDEAMLLTSWKNWLCSYAGVRRHFRIISKENKDKLSKECLYVAGHHANKFLGFLNYTWGQESKAIKSSLALTMQLKEIKVLCQGGQMVSLKDTWLPLLELQKEWEKFSSRPETFPFLKLDRELTRDSYANDWGFLVSSLGVSAQDDLAFYLKILLRIMTRKDTRDIYNPYRIFEVYNVIYGKYIAAPSDEIGARIRFLFNVNRLIYVPSSKYQNFNLTFPKDCVWEGSESLTIQAPLQARYKAMPVKNLSLLEPFFTKVLSIGNCDEGTICAQLDDLRESDSNDFDRIKTLYNSLWELLRINKSEKIKELIKKKFAETALIYTNSDNCWNKVSQCLWSSATTVLSKKVLESDYKGMKSFFVEFLGVDTLNLGLIYSELSKLGESKPTVELVKEQLLAFKDHLHTARDYKDVKPEGMKKFKIFPIRNPGDQQNIQFCDGNTEFAIADTVPLGDNFRQKIRTLGFTFDELHSLRPVIKCLETRYLSRLVMETSKVEDDDRVLNQALSRKIELKAHALCRIAKHFNSPRWRAKEELQNLYDLLKQAKVFETDKISCVQVVQQSGQSYSHKKSQSEFHLEESDSGLDIFVPQEKESQAYCLAYDLPARLFEWITTNRSVNDRNYSFVADILSQGPTIYNRILLGAGIVDIDIEDEDRADEVDSTSASSARWEASELQDSPSIRSNMATPLTDASSPRMEFDQVEIVPTIVYQDTIDASSHLAQSRNNNRLFTQGASFQASTGDIGTPATIQRAPASVNHAYSDLLIHVVSAARRALFPTKGIFDLDSLRTSLPSFPTFDNVYGTENEEFNYARSFPQLERDKMIGAAGELYVFELLKACNPSLPNFGIDNWKSTIRSYARKHPEYVTMQPWHGLETSDLVYHDNTGTFTKLLIDECYFDASIWKDRRPTYHFEVKTTVSSCDTRFFVSKKQYKMLHDTRGKEDSVYIIMRVFNVGNGNIGLRVYVDPAELEAEKELLFTAETWSVVPGA